MPCRRHGRRRQSQNLLVSALGIADTCYEGGNVGIAVIDSGLEKSEDLSGGRADKFFDFTTNGRSGHPYDDYGHGTHVATLIAGKGKASERDVERLEDGKFHKTKLALYRGLAPKARIISLKVLDGNGAGYTSSVLRALEFVVANREKLKIDIVNLSLGHPIYESPDTDPLVRAVEDATRAGIIVVAASGNHGMNQVTGEVGYAGITSPGNAPSAITVGALDLHDTVDRADDTVAPYSSRGPAWYSGVAKPDLVAPGHKLVAVGAFQGLALREIRRTPGVGPGEGEESALPAAQRQQHGRRRHERRRRVDGRGKPRTVRGAADGECRQGDPRIHGAAGPGQNALTQGTGGLNGAGAVLLAESIDPGRPVGAWWLISGVQPGQLSTGARSPGLNRSSGVTGSPPARSSSRTGSRGTKRSSGVPTTATR